MLPQNYQFVHKAPVIPVMVINDIKHAVPMARALIAGGLTTLEITLRTDCALEAIKEISRPVVVYILPAVSRPATSIYSGVAIFVLAF